MIKRILFILFFIVYFPVAGACCIAFMTILMPIFVIIWAITGRAYFDDAIEWLADNIFGLPFKIFNL